VPRIFVRQVDDGVKQAGITAHYGRIGGYDFHLAGLSVGKVSPVLPEYLLRKTGVVIIVYAFNLHDSRAYFAQEEIRHTLQRKVCLCGVVYRSQDPVVRGKGRMSRMFATPVIYISRRSKPRPKPECSTPPKRRRSIYH